MWCIGFWPDFWSPPALPSPHMPTYLVNEMAQVPGIQSVRFGLPCHTELLYGVSQWGNLWGCIVCSFGCNMFFALNLEKPSPWPIYNTSLAAIFDGVCFLLNTKDTNANNMFVNTSMPPSGAGVCGGLAWTASLSALVALKQGAHHQIFFQIHWLAASLTGLFPLLPPHLAKPCLSC